MNKRKKKKQKYLKWIGGSYRLNKERERQRHEETIAFKKKGRAGHLTDDDIKNFWMKDLDMYPEYIEKIFHSKRRPRGSKTAYKKASKALAQIL